jgi:hypothetical protein
MSKEFNSIGTNTDPLTVQLYFDDNNAIKWKIIFKDTNQIMSTEYSQQSSIPLNDQNNQIDSQQLTDHIITTLFPNLFIINSKNKYQFKYTDIQLELDDIDLVSYEIEYSSFDHFKFNKEIGEQFEKNIAWKYYLKNIKNSIQVKLDLNLIEISQINSLIKIMNMSIETKSKECLIIFGDFLSNTTNISWFKKNKDKFEISKGKILLLWYSTIDSKKNPDKKIYTANNFTNIKAFILKSQLYLDFLKKLNEKKITWETCLWQLIEENQFESYQIVPQLFM